MDLDPTDDVLPQLRIADAIQHVDQDLYGGYAVVADRGAPGAWPIGDRAVNAGTDGLQPIGRRSSPGGRAHVAAEPAVRARMVGLRRLRRLPLVALPADQTRAEPQPEPAPRAARLTRVDRLFRSLPQPRLRRRRAARVRQLRGDPAALFHRRGHRPQQLGETLSLVWVVHGWIYIAYVVVAFLLARRERWSVAFTLLMLVAGLIPLLIFWVERQVEHSVLAARSRRQ